MRRVIIVDDVDIHLRLIESLVRALADTTPEAFLSPTLALQAAHADPPHLFIVDYRMPQIDGMQFLDAVKHDPLLREIPVVMVTADEGRDPRYEALARGAHDFLTRPIDPREFSRRITNLLALEDARRRVAGLLDEQTRRAERVGTRFDALCRLATMTTLRDSAYLQNVLEEGAGVLRPGTSFVGFIARLDGAHFVVDTAYTCLAPDVQPPEESLRIPLVDSLVGAIVGAGEAVLCGDVQRDARFTSRRMQELPWRAVIGVPFRSGGTIYALGFVAGEALPGGFDAEDVTFLEALVSLCKVRLRQRAQAAFMRFQSEHDALTGILNRAAFRARGLACTAAGEAIAVAVLDIDHFRVVNDTAGQLTGDALLVEVAAAIQARTDGDILGRLGGDVFGVMLRGVTSRSDLEERLNHYLDAFGEPFSTGDREGKERIALTASCGVAYEPEREPNFEQLLAHADIAAGAAKDAGRARWAYFDPAAEQRLNTLHRTKNELALALLRDEFRLHFQPHVDLTTGRTVGAEALIRWQHPTRGLLSPLEFVPFAEEHGLMGAIGAWVIGESIRLSAPWRRADRDLRVWFNLSAFELLDPALFERLSAGGEDVAGMGVEITESVAMRDVVTSVRLIGRLREAGLAIALDDFGTGYSSLAQLKRLPLDVVKLDKAFVGGVPGDPHDEAIVHAVASICKRFNFALLAEGVETSSQASWLLSSGCNFAQGYLYARPMPADDFTVWLATHASAGRVDAV